MADYGHALLLASTCARGCDKIAPCVSPVDGKQVCGRCALAEAETILAGEVA